MPPRAPSVPPRPVPVTVRPLSAPSTGGARSRGTAVPGTGTAAYALALRDPFHASSNGVRVPDMFSAPTVTARISKRFTVTSDASGNVTLLCLPNATANAVVRQGVVSVGSSSWIDWAGNIINSYGLINTDPSNLTGKMSNYRIVSWGVKVIDIASMTNASGTITVAKTCPTTNTFVPHQLAIGGATNMNPNMTFARFLGQAGIPYTGTGSTAIPDTASLVSLPEHKVYTGLELAQQGVQIRSKPITSDAFNFKNVGDSYYGDDPIPGVATGAIYVGDSSYARLNGWELITLGGTGFPASTNVLDVELVYHLEGTPSNQGTSGVSLDGVVSSPCRQSQFLAALDSLSGMASFVPALQPAAGAHRAARAIFA